MTHRELMEWRYLETIEPFDVQRIEYQVARNTQYLYEAWKGSEAKSKTLGEFIVFDGKEPEEPKKQTAEDQVAIGEAMASTGLVKKG